MSTINTNTMTMREFLNAVVSAEALPAEVHAFAENQLVKLDSKNSSRATKQAEKAAIENAPLFEQFKALLAENPNGLLSSEVGTLMGIHPSKVTALGKKLIEMGAVTAEKVKVPKVGERTKFTLVTE